MSGQIRYTSDMLKDIENTLKEREETQGPYYSTYLPLLTVTVW